MAVVGIDFGNLSCVLAIAERGGVKVILNENSQRQNATLVSFQGAQRFLSEAAAPLASSNYKNTISSMKRLIGRKFDEPDVAAEMAWVPGVTFVKMPDGFIGVTVNYNDESTTFSITQIVSMMLFKCSEIVKADSGVMVADAVVSIPCWYTDSQRLAMRDACEIGGIHALRLMHDTTATAVEYGIYKSAKKVFDATAPQHVMFVDLGHASTSVSVVDFVIGKLVVKSTTFDRNLGGRDFDMAIAKWIATEFQAKHKDDPMSTPKTLRKLLVAAEKAKSKKDFKRLKQLKEAYEGTESLGSTTVLLAVLDNSTRIHGKLHPMVAVLTIGDCELLMLRRLHGRASPLQAVFHTEMQRIDEIGRAHV